MMTSSSVAMETIRESACNGPDEDVNDNEDDVVLDDEEHFHQEMRQATPDGAGNQYLLNHANSAEDHIPDDEGDSSTSNTFDFHLCHAILYGVLMTYMIAIIVEVVMCNGGGGCVHPCSFFLGSRWLTVFIGFLLYTFFLIESFCYSSTFKFLNAINFNESAMDYMTRLYQTKPRLELKMACYHYQQLEYGPYMVITWRGTEEVNIVHWQDESVQLQAGDFGAFQVARIMLSKKFTVDNGYEGQMESFKAANKSRDVSFNCGTVLTIPGYAPEVLAYIDIDKKPTFLGLGWYIFTHLTIFSSWPYRMWVSSISAVVSTTLHKVIHTEVPVAHVIM